MKNYIDIYSASKKDPFHENGAILGSMTTLSPPEAIKIAVHYMSKNFGDPMLFRSMGEMAETLIDMTREYLRLPEKPVILTSGGTESNIIALYSMAKETGRRKIVFPDTSHYSVRKACEIIRLKCIGIKTKWPGKIDYNELNRKIRDKKSIVVLTMGTTETGYVDDVVGFIDELERTQTPIHIDAAFGGFTFPFTHWKTYDKWIKMLEETKLLYSLSVDYHKFPGAPIPSGMIMVANPLKKHFIYKAPYISVGYQVGLLGTRPGFSVPATVATLLHYGKSGIEELAKEKYNDTLWFLKRVSELNKAFKVNKPMVPISCVKNTIYNSEIGLQEYMWRKGLYVYRCGDGNSMRIVHMPHVERKVLYKVLNALEEYSHLSSHRG